MYHHYFLLLTGILILAYALQEMYFSKKLGVPTVTSSRIYIDTMIAEIPSTTTGKILELGAGWGGLSIAAARALPHCQVVGIEYSPVPYLVCQLRRKMNPGLKNLTFVRRDFFEYPFHDVAVVLVFILEHILEKLRPKIEDELPAGTLVISNTHPIHGWTPDKVLEPPQSFDNRRIFVYHKPNKGTAS